MRSNPVGRIVRNLLEAERKEKERREWLETLFEPIGLDLFGCAPSSIPQRPAPKSPQPFVRLTNDRSHSEI